MRSLRRRLRLWLLATFGGLFAFTAATEYVFIRRFLLEQFDQALTAKAQSLATLVKYEPGEGVELDFADEFMPEFERAVDPEYFEVRLADGSPVERSRSLAGRDIESRGADDPAEGDVHDLVLPDGRAGRAVTLRLLAQIDTERRPASMPAGAGVGRIVDEPFPAAAPTGEPGRWVTVAVAKSTDEVTKPLAALRLGVIAVGGVLLAFALAALERALRSGLRPIEKLSLDVSAIDAGSLASRIAVDPPVLELAPIVHRLNDLLARLQEAFERQSRFTSSAAHELRNPIAELMAVCEVALKWPEEDKTRALEDALGAARQMEEIVAVLLAMARGESEAGVLRVERVDLAEQVRALSRPLLERAETRSLRFVDDVPEGATVATDPTLLRAILSNLLENAVEYATAGGRVRVAARREAGEAIVEIANTAGPEWRSPALLERLFEPFWRLDAASGARPHSGLGLSLARSLARSIGGRLDASTSDEGELLLALRLPADGAPVPRRRAAPVAARPSAPTPGAPRSRSRFSS